MAHTDSRADAGAAAAPDHRPYFTEFLPGILGRLLLEDLRTLSTAFEIDVTDADEPPWRLAVDAGRLVHVGADGPAPACRFALDRATLAEVVSGRLPPQEAFFELRIEVGGDVEEGLRLSTVLAPFFRRFPWTG